MRTLSCGALLLLTACGIDSELFGVPALDGGGGTNATGPGPGSGTGGTGSSSEVTTVGSGVGGTSSSSDAGASSASSSGASSSSASSSSASSSSASSSSASSSSGGGGGTCGNGNLEAGEVCDDLGSVGGDGCSATCQLEGNANQCPAGATFSLTDEVVVRGDTTGKKEVTTTLCGGSSAGDDIYQVIPKKAGTVTITLETPKDFDRILAVRSACTLGGVPYTCETNSTTLSFSLNAQANVAFHVVVTGLKGSEGSYVLRVAY